MIEGHATARYVRTSAQKAKLVLDLIRGRKVDDALATLRFARKSVAKDIAKVLRSAISNAQQKEGASGETDRLYVRSCYANQGPSLKRVRPAPMGRAFRITKRSAHLTVAVCERPETVEAVSVDASDAASEDRTSDAKPARRVTKKSTGKKKVAKKRTARKTTARKKATTKKVGASTKRTGRTTKG
jgi:large subunit ribosomal protein L22